MKEKEARENPLAVGGFLKELTAERTQRVTFGRLVNCPVGWPTGGTLGSPLLARFSLRCQSLLTLGFSTPADHDLAERSAK